jgi:hypothetical protein
MSKKNVAKKSPASKASPAKVPRSPAKKEKKEGQSPKKGGFGGRCPTLKVYGLPAPFSWELYLYESDCENDGYVHGLEQYLSNPEEGVIHDEVDDANFTQVVNRRIPGSRNEVLRNGKNNYFRKVIIRFVKDKDPSEETRQEGLDALKSFVMDSRFSRYPPTKVTTYDMTTITCRMALDKFIMDSVIKEFIQEDIPEDELDSTFVESYPDFAPFCWAGPSYSDFAKTIGFGAPEEV